MLGRSVKGELPLICGFGRLTPWFLLGQQQSVVPAVWELGSVYVEKEHRGKKIGLQIVEELVSRYNQKINALLEQYPETLLRAPLVAVVTEDNQASLKMFRGGFWLEFKPPDPNQIWINGVNIGWEHPSNLFVYQHFQLSRCYFDGQSLIYEF